MPTEMINAKLNKYFLIAKSIFILSPILGYSYIVTTASLMQLSFEEVLASDPSLTILLILTMINPYIFFLLNLVQQKLETDELDFVAINITILLLSQVLTNNLFYVMLISVLFYKIASMYNINFLEIIKKLSVKQHLVLGGGSYIVLFITLVCFLIKFQI